MPAHLSNQARIVVLTIVCVTCAAFPILGEPVELGAPVVDLNKYLEITKATPQEYTPERVKRERVFEDYAGYRDPDPGYEDVYWMRLSIHNPSSRATVSHLSIRKGHFWRALLFEWSGRGSESILVGEYNRLKESFGTNAIYPSISLPISVFPGETVDYYLMVKAYDVSRVVPRLLSDEEFADRNFVLSTIFGVAYGLVVGLCIYALLLLPVMRSRGGVALISLQVLSLCYLLLSNGFAFTIFGDQRFAYVDFALLPGFRVLLVAVAVLFSSRFLRLHTASNVHVVLIRVIIGLALAVAAIRIAGDPIPDPTAVAYAAVLLLLMFGTAVEVIHGIRHADRSLLLVAVAWVVFIATLVIGELHNFGIVIAFAPYLSIKGDQLGLVFFIGLSAAGVAKHVHDIHRSGTELRVARIAAERRAKDAEALDQAKTRFLANVTHELRTPIATIRIPIEEIVAHRRGEHIVADDPVFTGMLHQIDRLSWKIGTLLTHTRINEQRSPSRPVDVDLGLLLRRYLEGLAVIADTRNLSVSLALPETGRTTTRIDVDVFEAVIMNLLDNALKYTPDGGSVEITLEEAEGSYCLQIANSGEPIPPEMIERVFERGVSIEKTGDGIPRGNGIGLAVAKEAVEALHGTISVSSEAGGKVVFSVSIPAPGEPPVRKSVTDPAEHGDTTRHRLLLVEDDADLGSQLTSALTPEYQVLHVQSGEEALEAIKAEPFDLIIADIMMPGMDGITLLKRIRGRNGFRHLPCIFLTARSDTRTELSGLDAGAVAYLVKPVSTALLRKRIGSLLDLTDAVVSRLADDVTKFVNNRKPQPFAGTENKPAPEADRLRRIAHEYELTDRQTAVLQLLLKGYTSSEIGALLEISTRTVDNHVQAILKKVGVSRRSQLRYDLLDDDPGL